MCAISVMMIFAFGVDMSYAAEPTSQDCASGSGDIIGLGCVEKGSNLSNADPRIIVVRVINSALGLLGIIATVLILYAGFMWMTAGGNDEQVGKARKILIQAVIGLAIILSAWAITNFVLSNLYKATTGQPLGGYNL